MRELPIIFSPAMVVAILENRKQVTRRLTGNFNVGDHLYVREMFRINPILGEYIYYADYLYYADDWPLNSAKDFKWKPSIHMPKKAARLWLEVTSKRFEPLQDISDLECIEEGIPLGVNPRKEFRELWNSINEKRGYGWDTNPDVYVYTFRKIQK